MRSFFNRLLDRNIHQSAMFDENIYVIGDSHSLFWSGFGVEQQRIPFAHGIEIPKNSLLSTFKIFHLGPCLAYNMNRYGTKTQGLEKVEFLMSGNYLPFGATVMLCFGEIDIRVHVFKEGKQNMQRRIIGIVNNYMNFIDQMAKKFKVICYGPIASQKDDWSTNPAFPRNGNEYERNYATKNLTNILSDKCSQCGITFITLFDDLIDEHFSTKTEFIHDQCHLSPHLFPSACHKLFFLLKKNMDVNQLPHHSSPASD